MRLFTVVIACSIALAAAQEVTDLTGPGWTISNTNGSMRLAAAMPAYALEVLHASGRVANPLERYNELELRWTTKETWTFQRTFNVSAALLNHTAVDLLMTGVDTVADIFVDNVKLASVANAHREYRLPVKAALNGTAGEHMLKIVISPAPDAAQASAAAYPYKVPGLTQPGGMSYYNFIRKPASDFGWDWGPAFAPSGLYGIVELQAYDTAIITAATANQTHNANGTVVVDFTAWLTSPSPATEKGVLTVAAPHNVNWTASAPVSFGVSNETSMTVQMLLDQGTFDLWWPVGYGAQPLYNFTFSYAPANGTSNSTALRTLGLRKLELVRDPIGDAFSQGVGWETMYFQCNGVPIFAKGANSVPVDIFHSRATPTALRAMVATAVAANMNMLRVWGGGMYYPDAFYDACDAAGILVWQEAMFACSLYPSDAAFLDSVSKEITYQVRRLDHHASIAIWGGNNEIEVAFGWFPDSRDPDKARLYAADYNQLFVETVRGALVAVHPTANFVDSSPSNGVYSTSPYSKRWGIDGSDPKMGDTHFYNYGSDCTDVRLYPRSKFVSEFGTQSFTSFSVLRNVTAPSDWSYDSDMSNYRQRHDNGNPQLVAQMARAFKVPDAKAATASNAAQAGAFERFIYLTQVTQSRCYQAAISYWRRIKTEPDARTMGVLYWQLNDIWQGVSWSSVNYGGKWKLLMYAAKNFFNPLLVSAEYLNATATATAYITSDVPAPITGNLTWELVAWNATDGPAANRTSAFSVARLGSQQVLAQDMQQLLRDNNLDPATLPNYFLHLYARAGVPAAMRAATAGSRALGSTAEDPILESTWDVFPVPIKDAPVPTNASITWANFVNQSDSVATFDVSSNVVAPYVQLDSTLPGRFSDNAFTMLPWQNKTVQFVGEGPFSLADLQRSLSVLSIADTLPTAQLRDLSLPNLTTYQPASQLDLQSVFTGKKTGDPMALLGSSGIVPRVSSCAATPNPCPAGNATTSA
ncbi:hypothetical protein WJX81_001501 [Elliptochloris bilobata]|uniref:beta-mannosidase n=1 Tax=Elliptochloris bilobata TaxID=381761 RepID=A0AAW1RNM7_9CHLO